MGERAAALDELAREESRLSAHDPAALGVVLGARAQLLGDALPLVWWLAQHVRMIALTSAAADDVLCTPHGMRAPALLLRALSSPDAVSAALGRMDADELATLAPVFLKEPLSRAAAWLQALFSPAVAARVAAELPAAMAAALGARERAFASAVERLESESADFELDTICEALARTCLGTHAAPSVASARTALTVARRARCGVADAVELLSKAHGDEEQVLAALVLVEDGASWADALDVVARRKRADDFATVARLRAEGKG
eukprot:Amastigsp_a513201_11.p1 type:complete len:261 gc:universal Amastigsp_a513201_11:841-59(-)